MGCDWRFYLRAMLPAGAVLAASPGLAGMVDSEACRRDVPAIRASFEKSQAELASLGDGRKELLGNVGHLERLDLKRVVLSVEVFSEVGEGVQSGHSAPTEPPFDRRDSSLDRN